MRNFLDRRQAEMRERLKGQARSPRAALNAEQIALAQKLRRRGHSYFTIGERLHVHRDTVRKYVKRAN